MLPSCTRALPSLARPSGVAQLCGECISCVARSTCDSTCWVSFTCRQDSVGFLDFVRTVQLVMPERSLRWLSRISGRQHLLMVKVSGVATHASVLSGPRLTCTLQGAIPRCNIIVTLNGCHSQEHSCTSVRPVTTLYIATWHRGKQPHSYRRHGTAGSAAAAEPSTVPCRHKASSHTPCSMGPRPYLARPQRHAMTPTVKRAATSQALAPMLAVDGHRFLSCSLPKDLAKLGHISATRGSMLSRTCPRSLHIC